MTQTVLERPSANRDGGIIRIADHMQCWYQIWYDRTMSAARKITVEIPPELLKKAQQASGKGITQTVRAGLELIAASRAYDQLLKMRGKVRFSRTLEELKADR